MRICVVDGRGGGIGRRLVAGLSPLATEGHHVIGLGLNMVSAAAMDRAGATCVESRRPEIHRHLRQSEIIAGPLSLVLPGAMLGEVTPYLVQAVVDSPARKILLPVNRRNVEVVGVEGRTLDLLIEHAIQRILSLIKTTV